MQTDVAVLDLAGTTVSDRGIVLEAFRQAGLAMGLMEDSDAMDHVLLTARQTMGQSKITVFRQLFGDGAAQANAAFEDAYAHVVAQGIDPIPGAAEAIDELRAAGIKVALTTGFSPATRDALLAHLGWGHLADLALSPADVGRGRPYPDLALAALIRLGGRGVGNLAVVGDTVADMACGRAAGAGHVVGVLTGAGSEEALASAGATHVLDSVALLPTLLRTAPTLPSANTAA